MSDRPDSRSSQTSSHSDAGKPKVVYVMGRGKSGSTILGVTLGNCADMFFAGELCTWLMGSGKPVLGDAERVQFWQAVREDVDGAGLFGDDAFQCLERGLAAFRIDRWPARRRLREPFRRVTESLYTSIANRAGVSGVIDTSHLPLRALELQRMKGIDLYLIFLVRNTEGVVASYMRHVKNEHDLVERSRGFLVINARLWVAYLQSIIVFLRHPRDRRLLVRHEDFIADPQGVLRQILDVVGSPADIPDLTHLSTGIPLRGNRLTRSKVVALKAKPAPPERRSRLMKLAERPWSLVLARLRPAATVAASRDHLSASDPG
jgi:Sulfotransferase family